MDQQELFPLKNPCIGICQANNKGYCKGCLRSRRERQQWLSLNNIEKRHILHLCYLRHRKLIRLSHQQQKTELELPEQLDFKF